MFPMFQMITNHCSPYSAERRLQLHRRKISAKNSECVWGAVVQLWCAGFESNGSAAAPQERLLLLHESAVAVAAPRLSAAASVQTFVHIAFYPSTVPSSSCSCVRSCSLPRSICIRIVPARFPNNPAISSVRYPAK